MKSSYNKNLESVKKLQKQNVKKKVSNFTILSMALKINLIHPVPKGSKSIFSTPFRVWGKY